MVRKMGRTQFSGRLIGAVVGLFIAIVVGALAANEAVAQSTNTGTWGTAATLFVVIPLVIVAGIIMFIGKELQLF